jgi:NADH-quinone oxidoreductase subunit K
MITVLMCIELMLNAVNINLVAFSSRLSSLEGQIFSVFIITIAAGEAAVGLAIIIQLYRIRTTVNVDEVRELHG